MEVMAWFFPQGTTLLNRTEWRGKEPRSCGLTNARFRPYSAGSHEIDFGEFLGEFDIEGVPHIAHDEVLRKIQESPRFSASIKSSFMAPRRQRPLVKLVLSNALSGTATDGFGTRFININNFTPHLQQVILDELTELVSGFVEGRYSIKNMSNDELVFVELNDSLVDCTPNEQGKESRFNCLREYVPDSFLEDLAKRLRATYEIEVSIVDGPDAGLLLRPLNPPNRQ